MSLFESLKNPDFEERYIRETNVFLRDAYSKYPHHTQILSMTMYHLKEVLTNGDFQAILDWYNNLDKLKVGSILRGVKKKKKEVKRETKELKQVSGLTQEEVEYRDLLIKREKEFRFKLIKEYQRKQEQIFHDKMSRGIY